MAILRGKARRSSKERELEKFFKRFESGLRLQSVPEDGKIRILWDANKEVLNYRCPMKNRAGYYYEGKMEEATAEDVAKFVTMVERKHPSLTVVKDLTLL